MSDQGYPDYEYETQKQARGVGWFAAGAVAIAAAIGLFLYADGYFDATAETPPVIIEAP